MKRGPWPYVSARSIGLALYDRKSDPQDQTDWSTDFAMLHKMYCATVLRAVLIKYLFKNCSGSLYVVDLLSANSFNINYMIRKFGEF